MANSPAGRGRVSAADRNWLSHFHLVATNTANLVRLRRRDARRDWHRHGNVPVRIDHDCSECGGVRA